MTLDRTWLLGVASAEREALGRTIQYTDPSYWEKASRLEGWRVRDVVAHLAASEVFSSAVLGDEEPTEVEEYVKSAGTDRVDLDGFNGWAVARRADLPLHHVAMEWGRAADLLLARASKTSEEDWRSRAVRWFTGDLKLGYLIQARVSEWWSHGDDIRTGSDQPPRVEHPPIFCLNDLAIRMLPYALGLDGKSYPGRSVQVTLEGAGEGRWHYGLQAGFIPPKGKEPDAYILGRAPAFALVAARRADPDVALYDGALNIGGDTELARSVLQSIRSFA